MRQSLPSGGRRSITAPASSLSCLCPLPLSPLWAWCSWGWRCSCGSPPPPMLWQRRAASRYFLQVNRNLDHYLRSMMRVSNTAYYQVIRTWTWRPREIWMQRWTYCMKTTGTLWCPSLCSPKRGSDCRRTACSTQAQRHSRPEIWFTTAMEQIENLHFSTPHVQNLFQDPDHHYRWVVS